MELLGTNRSSGFASPVHDAEVANNKQCTIDAFRKNV